MQLILPLQDSVDALNGQQAQEAGKALCPGPAEGNDRVDHHDDVSLAERLGPKALAKNGRQHAQVSGRPPNGDLKHVLYDDKIPFDNAALRLSHDMCLFVKPLSGEAARLTVDSKDTIRSVKKQIRSKLEIPLNHQHLIFAGAQLIDSHPLSEYSIEPGSTLYLIVRFVGTMTVHVQDAETDERLALNAEPLDTVSKVKAKLCDELGLLPKYRHLYFGGRRLEGDRTLSDYNISGSSTLYMKSLEAASSPKLRKTNECTYLKAASISAESPKHAALRVHDVGKSKGEQYSKRPGREHLAPITAPLQKAMWDPSSRKQIFQAGKEELRAQVEFPEDVARGTRTIHGDSDCDGEVGSKLAAADKQKKRQQKIGSSLALQEFEHNRGANSSTKYYSDNSPDAPVPCRPDDTSEVTRSAPTPSEHPLLLIPLGKVTAQYLNASDQQDKKHASLQATRRPTCTSEPSSSSAIGSGGRSSTAIPGTSCFLPPVPYDASLRQISRIVQEIARIPPHEQEVWVTSLRDPSTSVLISSTEDCQPSHVHVHCRCRDVRRAANEAMDEQRRSCLVLAFALIATVLLASGSVNQLERFTAGNQSSALGPLGQRHTVKAGDRPCRTDASCIDRGRVSTSSTSDRPLNDIKDFFELGDEIHKFLNRVQCEHLARLMVTENGDIPNNFKDRICCYIRKNNYGEESPENVPGLLFYFCSKEVKTCGDLLDLIKRVSPRDCEKIKKLIVDALPDAG
ncbi:uncharacterized protein LOC135815343 [Sycon ciliatum]|uniref:uncharacterized protein LOC135815343 n=1 Tax=Sycon ciliatum TaxID=27933 RepID=UPI0031F6EDE3